MRCARVHLLDQSTNYNHTIITYWREDGFKCETREIRRNGRSTCGFQHVKDLLAGYSPLGPDDATKGRKCPEISAKKGAILLTILC